MPDTPRNVAGPADPETRRRLLQIALRGGSPMKTTKPEVVANTTSSAFDAARDLARRGRQIDMAVDDPDEYKRRQRQVEAMRGKLK